MDVLKKTEYTQGIPVFQHDKAMHLAQGGFNLDVTGLTSGSKILRGTVLGFDEATRIAKVLKAATVVEVAGGTATDYNVAKGHLFVVGDIPTAGTAARAITAINTSNANYDTITVSATLGAVDAGGSLYAALAAVASAPAVAVTPKGLLYKEVTVGAEAFPLADVVLRGTVYARRIPAVAASVQAVLPRIIFSQSF